MFKYVRDNGGSDCPVTKTIPGNTGVTYAPGMALVITSGKAAKCGATASPVYICAGKGLGLSEVAAYQVLKGQEYKVPVYGDGTGLAVGDKVTLHTDGLQVTGTTTSGVAEIIEKLGTGASGSEVIVRF